MDAKLDEIESLKSEILNAGTALEHLEEGSDFFLVEEGVWCWIEDGEAVTTKDFHLSRGGAIEDFERYVEGRDLHWSMFNYLTILKKWMIERRNKRFERKTK